MMENTREALRHIRNGMLFVGLAVTVNGFDLLPDFVGWYWMLKALFELEEEVPRVKRLLPFGMALPVLSLIEWGQTAILYQRSFLVGLEASFRTLVGILQFCLFIYFLYQLLAAAAGAAEQWGGSAGTCKKLCKSRDLMLFAKILFTVFAHGILYLEIEGRAAAVLVLASLLGLVLLYAINFFYCVFQVNALRKQLGAQAEPGQQAEG